MTPRLVALALAAALPACGGDAREAARAYRDGRWVEAHEAYVRAVGARGDDAPAWLLYNRALAALRAGALRDAEVSADRAAARGGGAIVALHDFLTGCVAFARCETAARQAGTVEAEPFAFDAAIAFGRKAREAWQSAAMRRDWPAARRNVERALLMLEELQRRKEAADKPPRRRPDGKPQPRPRPGEPPAPKPPSPAPAGGGGAGDGQDPADARLDELSPAQVRALLDTLASKEREKRALRAAHRRTRTADVERDW